MNEGYKAVDARLKAGGTIVLDGGVGTEMQRQGAAMSGEVWCALATRSHPDVLAQVHLAYIDAGADVITANTFATSPLILARHGYLNEMEPLDALAVEIAREAAAEAGRPVCVAGSMSAMRPIVPGTDRIDETWARSEGECRDLFRRKADHLAQTGVDLIIMEMMRDTDYSVWASEAARETGLPLWIGVSCRHRKSDGVLVGYNRHDCTLDDVVAAMAALEPQAMLVMHTSVNDVDDALPALRAKWHGVAGAYPESGHFTIPDWVFGDIPPEAFAERAMGWVDAGARIIGGCCGVTPEHVKAFSGVLARRQQMGAQQQ